MRISRGRSEFILNPPCLRVCSELVWISRPLLYSSIVPDRWADWKDGGGMIS